MILSVSWKPSRKMTLYFAENARIAFPMEKGSIQKLSLWMLDSRVMLPKILTANYIKQISTPYTSIKYID